MNERYDLREIKVGNDKFHEYYKRQFKDVIQTDAEFDEFEKTLYDKLPVTFRVNPGLNNHEAMI